MGDLLDSRVKDFGREVLCADVSSHSDSITTCSHNLVDHYLCFCCVKAFRQKPMMRTMREQERLGSHSLTTTFAPSFANSSAALFPMPLL